MTELYQRLAQQSADRLTKQAPEESGELDARGYADARVALLDAGFSYDEVTGLCKALSEASTQGAWPRSEDAWTHFVTQVLAPAPAKDLQASTLYFINLRYERRLAARTPLDFHERLVHSLSKRIRAFLAELESDAVRQDAVATLASACDCQPELIWRISTAGKRVPSKVLAKFDHALRRLENDLAIAGDA